MLAGTTRREGSASAATVPHPNATLADAQAAGRQSTNQRDQQQGHLAGHLVILVQVLVRQIKDGAPALLHSKRVTTTALSQCRGVGWRFTSQQRQPENGGTCLASEQQPAEQCTVSVTEQRADWRRTSATARYCRWRTNGTSMVGGLRPPPCTGMYSASTWAGQRGEGRGGESQCERAYGSRQRLWLGSAAS